MLKLVKNDDSLLDCIHDPISITHGVRFSTQKISKKHLYTPPKKNKTMNFHFSKYFSPQKIHIPNNGTTTPLLNHFTCFLTFWGGVKNTVRLVSPFRQGAKWKKRTQPVPSSPKSWKRMVENGGAK